MPKRVVQTKTTFLEMLEPPSDVITPPIHSTRISRINTPSVDFYKFLYRAVGSDFNWIDRLLISDVELGTIIHDDRVDVFVLEVNGESTGFSELDRRVLNEVEIAYFGLLPQFVGKGLGKFFLNWTLREAWANEPTRVWLHTCDLDHEAALPNYLRAGFQVYDEKVIDQVVID